MKANGLRTAALLGGLSGLLLLLGQYLGGSNGLVGVWPAPWLASKTAYYWVALALCTFTVAFLVKTMRGKFGQKLRAVRDSPLRAEASGIHVRHTQWMAFTLAGFAAGFDDAAGSPG